MAKSDDKADIWMPLYIGDYLADTSRLTTEQHGAYLLLMMDYWRVGPPPDDDEILQNVTRLSKFLWKKHRPVLEKLFSVKDGAWHHKRLDEEIARARAGSSAASIKARIAAEARWGKKDAPSTAPDMLEECPSPSPSPSPTENLKTYSPTGDSGRPANVDSDAPLAAADVSIALIGWERDRHKAARGINASHPTVIELSEMHVTADELRQAYDMAVADRLATEDPNPVNAGFVKSMVLKVRNPPKPRPKQDDWNRSDAGIARKAKELRVTAGAGWSYDRLKEKVWDEIRRKERQGEAA